MLDFFDRPFDVNLASSLGERREAGLLQRSLTIGQRTAYSAVGPISFTYAVDGQDVQSQRLARLGLSPSQERAARLIAGIAVARLTGESSVAVGFGTGSSTIRDQFADRLVNGSPLADSASSMMGFYPASVNSIGYSHQIANWRLFLAVEKGSISPSRGELDAPYSMMQWSAERSRSNGRIRLGTSWLVERRTMLGGTFNPMFGDGNSRTWFADLEAERKLGLGWSLRGDFRLGKTSFLSGQVTTSAFSLDLAKTGVLSAQDALMFRLWQPLRVESGSVGLTLPISWDYKTRTATDGRRSLSLIPSGRELSLEVGYDRTLPAGHISLHLFTRRNAEHSRTSDVDAGLAVRSRLKL
jgi:hypothetical protein